MEVHLGISSFKKNGNTVVTSGTFDGVHIGHQKLIESINTIAKQINGKSVLITFWPHPRLVLDPNNGNVKLLNTFEEKAELLEKAGLDHLIRIPFTREFSLLKSEDFIRNILVDGIGTKKLIIGYDHRFGHNREGSFEALKIDGPKYGFDVEEIPRQDIEHIGVSSSKIRNHLKNGEIHLSNQYLGREYSISGTVIKGNKLGRTIGFPTANIQVNSDLKLIPSKAAYAVNIKSRNNIYKGMLNIGVRPTINGFERVIETNIFNFNEEIYGETITIFFVRMIRQEIKFPSLDALKLQLIEDKATAMKWL